eukprot:3559062-Pleurochrysis_carterae.AAC.4
MGTWHCVRKTQRMRGDEHVCVRVREQARVRLSACRLLARVRVGCTFARPNSYLCACAFFDWVSARVGAEA